MGLFALKFLLFRDAYAVKPVHCEIRLLCVVRPGVHYGLSREQNLIPSPSGFSLRVHNFSSTPVQNAWTQKQGAHAAETIHFTVLIMETNGINAPAPFRILQTHTVLLISRQEEHKDARCQ